MKEIVWIFGASASGKETLINKLIKNEPIELIKRLDWENKKIAACQESLDFTYKNVESREKILEKVPELLENADIVLVKWQYVDSKTDRPLLLKKLMPKTKHKIIELRAELDELVERLPKRRWWTDYGKEKDLYDKELKLIADELTKLKREFKITTLDSSESADYRALKN